MLILSKKHTTLKERFRQKDIMSRKIEIYFVEIHCVSFMFFLSFCPKNPHASAIYVSFCHSV